MNRSFSEKCGRVQAGVLAVLSMIMIWLPALDTFLHLDKSHMPNENRAMARFPEFQSGLEGFHNYIAGLELYYNDHFGFRSRLIRWQHRWKWVLFKESSTQDTITGRDGWLFYSGAGMIEIEKGINRFTPDQLKAWQQLLESRRDWCVRHGCAYIFVIASDKHSVYPEYLPDWLLPVSKPTKLDQFFAYMKTNSTVPVLDLRPALMAAKTNGILWLKTDTHWNSLGAVVGYQSLITALSAQWPGLKPLPLDAFGWKLAPPQSGGDLARMLGQEESMPEKATMIMSLLPPLKPLSITVDTNLLVRKWVKSTEPTFTTNPDAKGKVIVFHDSFAGPWYPLLGYHFNTVIFIWQNNWNMALLEQQKPDVVIDEMVERAVVSKDPASLNDN
jgi:hypothetical protein